MPLADNTVVRIGKRVLIRNLYNQITTDVVIGSYMVLSKSGAISYLSPLAKIIIGAKKGETRSGEIGGESVSFTVEEIS